MVWSSWFDDVEPDQHDQREERVAAADLVEVLARRARLVRSRRPRSWNSTLRGLRRRARHDSFVQLRETPRLRRAFGERADAGRSSAGGGSTTACRRAGSGTRMFVRRAYQRSTPSRASPSAAPRPPGRSISTSSMPAPVDRNAHSGGTRKYCDALHVDRAEHRAADRAEPADDDHREHLQPGDGIEVVGVERVLLEHEQRAGDAGEEARDARTPCTSVRRACRRVRLRGAFVLAHADEHAPDPARAQAAHHPDGTTREAPPRRARRSPVRR